MLDTYSMTQQLSGDYKNVFEKADMYSTINADSVGDMNEKMMDLYDILMEAQHEGKPIEKIVGDDVEKFCRNFFVEAQRDEKLAQVFKSVYNVMRILFIFTVLDFLIMQNQSGISENFNILPFLGGMAAGWVLTAIFKICLQPIIFKKKIHPMACNLIILGLFVLSIVLTVELLGEQILEIDYIYVLIASGIYCAIYLIGRSIWRYKKYGRITKLDEYEKKNAKKIEKAFNDEISEKTSIKVSINGLARRFERLNKKKLKKNQQELTQQEFAKIIRDEEGKRLSQEKMMALGFSIFVIGSFISEAVNSTIIDGIIYGAVLAVAEWFIYKTYKKANREAIKAQLFILEECDKLEVNIIEYANMNK